MKQEYQKFKTRSIKKERGHGYYALVQKRIQEIKAVPIMKDVENFLQEVDLGFAPTQMRAHDILEGGLDYSDDPMRARDPQRRMGRSPAKPIRQHTRQTVQPRDATPQATRPRGRVTEEGPRPSETPLMTRQRGEATEEGPGKHDFIPTGRRVPLSDDYPAQLVKKTRNEILESVELIDLQIGYLEQHPEHASRLADWANQTSNIAFLTQRKRELLHEAAQEKTTLPPRQLASMVDVHYRQGGRGNERPYERGTGSEILPLPTGSEMRRAGTLPRDPTQQTRAQMTQLIDRNRRLRLRQRPQPRQAVDVGQPQGIVQVPPARLPQMVQPMPQRSTVYQVPGKTKSSGLKVIQKVNVTQQSKVKKKSSVGKKRKEYNRLKKALLAVLKKSKTDTYKQQNESIKKLPLSQRKSARSKLKKELQERLAKLKQKLPSSSKLKTKELDRLISLVKTIKW